MLHLSVPRSREKGVLVHEVPAHSMHLLQVLLEGDEWARAWQTEIPELEAAVATSGNELVRVALAPAAVEHRVLCKKLP